MKEHVHKGIFNRSSLKLSICLHILNGSPDTNVNSQFQVHSLSTWDKPKES